MCDGQAAKDCEIISYAEYESMLNDQTTKLEDKFSILSQEIQAKKDACVEICHKDPRISYDDALDGFLSSMQKLIRDFNMADNHKDSEKPNLDGHEPQKLINNVVVCHSFSDNNSRVVLSNNDRSVKCERSIDKSLVNESHRGYCFLEHPKISNTDILIWTLKISKFRIGDVGKVMINNLCLWRLSKSIS